MKVYEYKLLALLPGIDGIGVAEQRLNAWAGEGWRLLPVIVGNGWGILEREVRA